MVGYCAAHFPEALRRLYLVLILYYYISDSSYMLLPLSTERSDERRGRVRRCEDAVFWVNQCRDIFFVCLPPPLKKKIIVNENISHQLDTTAAIKINTIQQ